ncbi:MAG: PAS domain S-box protein [Desulfomonilaceae bacterium]|nr:PAS domain S-box protein [Desulfomonilaceae bacterium]
MGPGNKLPEIASMRRRVSELEDIQARLTATEQALRESEARFRALSEHTFEAIFLSEKGLCTDQNIAAEKMFGYTREEAVGRPGTDWIAPEHRELVKNNMQMNYAPPYEVQALRKDGTTFPCQIQGKMVEVQGRLVRVTSLRDISDLKRTEAELRRALEELEERVEARTAELTRVNEQLKKEMADRDRSEESLRASEEMYRALVETTDTGYVILDDRGRVAASNAEYVRLTGHRSPDEIQGRSTAQWTAAHDRQRIPYEIKRIFDKGYVRNLEVDYVDGKGTIVPVEINATAASTERGTHIIALCRDITYRRQVEEVLRKSEERFRSLIDQAADAIFVHDLDGRFLEVNQQACTSLGYAREELLSMSVDDVDPEIASREERAGSWASLPVTLEGRLKRKDGTSFPVEVHLGPIVHGDTKVVLAVVRDITDRRRAEEELREAKNLAETANRAKSEFLANMSHELRTPLNAIIGFAEILEDQLFGTLNEAQKTHVGYIVQSGHHLLKLVSEILDLAKIESGGMHLELSQVNVAQVLENSMLITRRKSLTKDLTIELKVDPEIEGMTIQVDELKLKQVMLNLLSNAEKFTPEGGGIRVEAQRVEDELIISVCDTGVGIDASDTSLIFRAFEQVDSTLARHYQGTGLGLSLVRKLVEMHGGRTWVESEGRGKGSSFRFTIPLINRR